MKIWLGSDDCSYLASLLQRLSDATSAKTSRKHLARLSDKVKPAGRYVDFKQSEILYLKALMHDAQKTLEKIDGQAEVPESVRERALFIRTAVTRIVAQLGKQNA